MPKRHRTSHHALEKDDHQFRPMPTFGNRSPCPALNSLANHGYIPREGTNLGFWDVFRAVSFVYNLSYVLSFILTLGGFITSGTFKFDAVPILRSQKPSTGRFASLVNCIRSRTIDAFEPVLEKIPTSWRLDLASLAHRGPYKIAHDASLVHSSGVASTAPDPALLKDLLSYSSNTHDVFGNFKDGMNIVDLANLHRKRLRSTPEALNMFHAIIGLGECALTWEMLRSSQKTMLFLAVPRGDQYNSVNERDWESSYIPTPRLKQWLGEERLPDGWWGRGGVRPRKTVGVLQLSILILKIYSIVQEGS
ncbi:hypothetical protein CVT24_001950 [Panaeolus cyanescens]|uniref:Heme haloperoxidase family profile domain-containing protein n=1 Tax=Panaeolus cyanescens TaxID=181874 RepID=A0A409YHR1_9AGAR|nr:hypothetical protein CVT24_001950 [Panaeolus cyanescens]